MLDSCILALYPRSLVVSLWTFSLAKVSRVRKLNLGNEVALSRVGGDKTLA